MEKVKMTIQVTVKRYCPACGAPLDEEGICTRTTCPRRALQLKAKETAEAVEEANQRETLSPEGKSGH